MALTCGIVGLPNVGKSTIFNALTAAGIQAENYPFCTIEPNTGVVTVPDARLAGLDGIVHSKQVIPTTIEFVDIAGIVKGASKGEGLGNKFLGEHPRNHGHRARGALLRRRQRGARRRRARSHPRRRDDRGRARAGRHRDRREATRPRAQGGTQRRQAGEARSRILRGTARASLGRANPRAPSRCPTPCGKAFRDCFLLTAKPILYVANVDDASLASGNDYSRALEEHAAKANAEFVRICGKVEAELSELPDDEKREFLEELGVEEPGLDRLIRAAYTPARTDHLLHGRREGGAGMDDPRGATAPPAAGQIHSDFEKHFIRAEVIPFDTYIELRRRTRRQGQGRRCASRARNTSMQDGDVVHFRVGV